MRGAHLQVRDARQSVMRQARDRVGPGDFSASALRAFGALPLTQLRL